MPQTTYVPHGAQRVGDLAQAQGNPTAPKPDTLQERLNQSLHILGSCENIVFDLRAKLSGTVPDINKQPEQPQALYSMAMEICNRAQRLQQDLDELNRFLA